MKHLHCLLFIVVLVFYSCANKVAPTGGNKDTMPPKVISSKPENFSTGFTGNEIKIEFDEYVQLVDLTKQLIISPLIDPVPEITSVKKTISIKFEKALKENTTYTFNFGNSIADIHEKNIYENFLFVFSTGNYLDSLSIFGKVSFAENNKTEKVILVMLYKNGNDSSPIKKLPDYFAKTADDGLFKISYIGTGGYKIFALKDKNNNYLFDQPDEEIAFTNETIIPGDSANLELALFKNAIEKIRLRNTSVETQNKIKIIFNARAKNIRVQAMGEKTNPWTLEEYSINSDTLVLWMTDTTKDSLKVVFYQSEIPFDTASFFLQKKISGKGNVTAKTVTVSNNTTNSFLEPGKQLTLQFSNPLTSVNPEKSRLTKDSVHAQGVHYSFSDSIKRNLILNYDWKENERYELIFYPGTFKDILNLTNDTIKISFKLKPANEMGNVTLKLKTTQAANYIVQLVNDKDEVIREKITSLTGDFHFDLLSPGSFRFRIIVDANKNNRWDTGNYFSKVQPEQIIYYKESVSIRANWDLEVEWTLE